MLIHAKVAGTVDNEGINFAERSFVEQEFDPFMGGHFAFGFVGSNSVGAAAIMRFLPEFL